MRRLFYDTSCPACKRIVKRAKSVQNNKLFQMSSLDGKKAKLVFQGNYAFLRKKKSRMVMVEGPRVRVKGNAMFRVYWLMGGKWKILGILSYLPGFMTNPFITLWVKILKLRRL